MSVESASADPLDRIETFKELYPAVRERIREHLPPDWPEIERAMSTMLSGLPPLAVLPLASAAATGGEPTRAIPFTAAWVVFNVAYRLLDDLQDQDRPDGYWAELGVPRASNVATALVLLGFELMGDNPWSKERERGIRELFCAEAMRVAAGQDRDLRGETHTLEAYWQTIEDKNARIYAVACACGALSACDEPALVEACHRYGFHLGLALQVFDDLQGLWAPEGEGDLAMGKITYPILYGLNHEHDRRDELQALVDRGRLGEEQERVREILDQIETRQFMAWTALQERDQALTALAPCPGQLGKQALTAFANVFFAHLDRVAGLLR